MSGKHRKPDAELVQAPPPDVDLAERLGGRPAPRPTAVRDVVGAPVAARIVPRRNRSAERARRRAAARRRLLLATGVVVALALGAVGAVLLLGGGDDDGPPAARTGPAAQQTLLLQVTGGDGVSAASALLGAGDGAEASAVLVPSGVLVDVAGTGTVPFGETTTLPEASAPAQALTDLVGVRVDDSWVLSGPGLAALVDAVGGVRATVDVDVLSTDAEGNQTVVVRAGTQQLGGTSAAAYATYLGEGEPEQARLARFDEVLLGVLAALPAEAPALESLVGGLGEASRSTLDPIGLAGRLAPLRDAVAAEELVSDLLPVTEIDTGGGAPTYGIDSGQVGAMMRARFPGALQTDAGGEVLRVLVENGVGTPGLVEQAREKLVAAGFRFVNGGNAASFTGDPSVVIIPDGTEQSVSRGQRVAAALGLPDSAIAPSDRGQTVADVIVILGSDFTP